MDLVNASNDDASSMGQRATEGDAAQADDYKNKVDELFMKVGKVSICSFYNGLNYHEYCSLKICFPKCSDNAIFHINLDHLNLSDVSSSCKLKR